MHENSVKKFPNRHPDILKSSDFYMSPDFDAPLEDFKELYVKYLLDTHALLWYLFDSENLSQTAKEIINNELLLQQSVIVGNCHKTIW